MRTRHRVPPRIPDTADRLRGLGRYGPRLACGRRGPAQSRPSAFPGAERGSRRRAPSRSSTEHDEVPDRFWAPEVAGLGRRTLALLVDQSRFCWRVLGVFFLGALMALRLSGLDTSLLLSGRGSAGIRPSPLRAARRAAQPGLFQLLSRFNRPHARQGTGRHRGSDRRRRRLDLGPGDPALARCGPRPGVCRRRHPLGVLRAAPARVGQYHFRHGDCPETTEPAGGDSPRFI